MALRASGTALQGMNRPLRVCAGELYTFTIEEGANGTNGRISVNYDGFIDDVSVGDTLLVDGGIMSLKLLAVEGKDVHCQVMDGGVMKSRCAHSLFFCQWQEHVMHSFLTVGERTTPSHLECGSGWLSGNVHCEVRDGRNTVRFAFFCVNYNRIGEFHGDRKLDSMSVKVRAVVGNGMRIASLCTVALCTCRRLMQLLQPRAGLRAGGT